MKAAKHRKGFTRDNAWLRRARRHFCGLLRRWADRARDPIKYRERVCAIAEALVERKLLAECSVTIARYTPLSIWAKQDGMRWWQWRDLEQRRKVAAMHLRDFHQWMQLRHKRRA